MDLTAENIDVVTRREYLIRNNGSAASNTTNIPAADLIHVPTPE